jgi:translation initiation factor 2B subunit (eIF-2B alpha/beta/delta family)
LEKKEMDKQKKFNEICRDIKSLKIQGASELAKKAFYAYKLIPRDSLKKKLLLLRPTEPMLDNIFQKYSGITYNELKGRLENNQDKINKEVYRLIKNNSVIFTHCHASTVVKALIYSRKKGKRFEVHNTETRPLYQGRKTSMELRKAKIPVTMFVDSAVYIALTKSLETKKTDLILIGTDAITKKGAINKVGSRVIAELAKINKIPFFIVTDSLKFTNKKIRIENRNPFEIWRTKKIKINNPAFEYIPKKYITGVISEFGNLKFKEFIKKARTN